MRDVNTYTVSGLVAQAGGIPLPRGIVPDRLEAVLEAARAALGEADMLVISAGSSVSVRDLTARVISSLGAPGILVHGVALRPGKPTLLGICDGKAAIGLPGNPVSAMVVSELFLLPVIRRLLGVARPPEPRVSEATLALQISSVTGREDHIPVKLEDRDGEVFAHPVFGKSNLIYTMVKADGLVTVPIDANGLHEGDSVHVRLF